MAKNVIISRELKDSPAAVEFLTRAAAGFEWTNDRRAAVVLTCDTPAAAVAADWLFWDYDTDYNYKNIATRRRPC